MTISVTRLSTCMCKNVLQDTAAVCFFMIFYSHHLVNCYHLLLNLILFVSYAFSRSARQMENGCRTHTHIRAVTFWPKYFNDAPGQRRESRSCSSSSHGCRGITTASIERKKERERKRKGKERQKQQALERGMERKERERDKLAITPEALTVVLSRSPGSRGHTRARRSFYWLADVLSWTVKRITGSARWIISDSLHAYNTLRKQRKKTKKRKRKKVERKISVLMYMRSPAWQTRLASS